jgi:hypothetical protein
MMVRQRRAELTNRLRLPSLAAPECELNRLQAQTVGQERIVAAIAEPIDASAGIIKE